MTRSKARWLAVVLLGGWLAALLVGAVPAWAQIGDPAAIQPQRVAKPCDSPDCSGNPPPTPAPNPTDPPPQHIIDTQILNFPVQALYLALIASAKKVVLEANNGNYYADDYYSTPRVAGANEEFGKLLGAALTDRYGLAPQAIHDSPDQFQTTTPLFQDLILPYWKTSFGIALALVPLTLALTIASVMQLGAGSTLAYADLKDAMVHWLTGLALAASSYFILALVHRLVLQVAGVILFGPGGAGATYNDAVKHFGDMLVLQMDRVPFLKLGASVQLLLGLMQLGFNFGLVLILSLGYAGYVAVLFLLAVLAPAVFILSTAPPLRWLQSTWIKGLTLAGLLPILNALLVSGTLMVFWTGVGNVAHSDGRQLFSDYGNYLKSLMIAAGLLGLYLTVNYKVMETIFGAVAELAGKAAKATTDTLALAAVAVAGAALLPGLVGGMGSAASAGPATSSTTSGATGAGGAAATGGGPTPPPTGGPSSAAAAGANGTTASGGSTGAVQSDVAARMRLAAGKRQAGLVRNIGSAVSRSGVPGGRALGGAMQMLGASKEAEFGDALAQAEEAHAAQREQYADDLQTANRARNETGDELNDLDHPAVGAEAGGSSAGGGGKAGGSPAAEPNESSTEVTSDGNAGAAAPGGSPAAEPNGSSTGATSDGNAGAAAPGGSPAAEPNGSSTGATSGGNAPASSGGEFLTGPGGYGGDTSSAAGQQSDVADRMRQASQQRSPGPRPGEPSTPPVADTSGLERHVSAIENHLPAWNDRVQYQGHTYSRTSGADHLAGLLAGEAEQHGTPRERFESALSRFSSEGRSYEQPADMIAGLDHMAGNLGWGEVSPGVQDFVYRLYEQEPPRHRAGT